jgi:hypothetical protein
MNLWTNDVQSRLFLLLLLSTHEYMLHLNEIVVKLYKCVDNHIDHM